LNVLLTFDVEIWCQGWHDLDARFPASFDRYVYGRSSRGDYAIPRTLSILDGHGLKGIFFVEPLFAARFGLKYLKIIVDMIRSAGQEVQLHLHPEWTDEIKPAPIPAASGKRQHLNFYSCEEQTKLVNLGLSLLRDAGIDGVAAFRAGSFAGNRDTFRAVAANGIPHDSSLNATLAISGPDLRDGALMTDPAMVNGVVSHPVAVIRDGAGRLRHAQVGSCGFAEMRSGIHTAAARGHGEFVIQSHNFEMLRRGSSEADPFVVRRFEKLCAFLDKERETYPTVGFRDVARTPADCGSALPSAPMAATAVRMFEQALRRLSR
jgi:hypothetical protein